MQCERKDIGRDWICDACRSLWSKTMDDLEWRPSCCIDRPCPICGGKEDCDHTFKERLAKAYDVERQAHS